MDFDLLTQTRIGKRVCIIGKGNSIFKLGRKDFDEDCSIITLNEAIEIIRELNLPNETFTLQRDKGLVVPISPEILLVHCEQPYFDDDNICKAKSYDFCPDYKPRYVLDSIRLGIRPDHPSIMCATSLACRMGFSYLDYYGFDSVFGDDNGVDGRCDDHKQMNELAFVYQLKLSYFIKARIYSPDDLKGN